MCQQCELDGNRFFVSQHEGKAMPQADGGCINSSCEILVVRESEAAVIGEYCVVYREIGGNVQVLVGYFHWDVEVQIGCASVIKVFVAKTRLIVGGCLSRQGKLSGIELLTSTIHRIVRLFGYSVAKLDIVTCHVSGLNLFRQDT